jgi:hypothetical protein
MSGSLQTVATQLEKCKLVLVRVTVIKQTMMHFCGEGNDHHHVGTAFLYIREFHQELEDKVC